MTELLFAIPAFNEATTIGSVVRSLLPFGRVLVVDDGSSDSTEDAACLAGATVHRLAINAGYDTAVTTGLDLARCSPCDWILTFDADGQHSTSDIARFQPHFANKDLILGIRPARSMRIGEHLLSLYYRRKHRIHDPFTGFKAYRRNFLERVALPQVGAAPSYGLDILDAVLRASPRIDEVAISIRDRADNARIGDSWKVNKRMFRCLQERLTR